MLNKVIFNKLTPEEQILYKTGLMFANKSFQQELQKHIKSLRKKYKDISIDPLENKDRYKKYKKYLFVDKRDQKVVLKCLARDGVEADEKFKNITGADRKNVQHVVRRTNSEHTEVLAWREYRKAQKLFGSLKD